MLGIDQNCFIREYRKQVEKEALSHIQDDALSNMMNAFGQLNQTYQVLFKDICLTFGTLLSVKEELKVHRSEVVQKQKQSSIQEQLLIEKVQNQEMYIENIQKQLKSTQIQLEQEKNSKQNNAERDQMINQYKQRLFDMQEREQAIQVDKQKLQTKIQQLEEKINKSDQITIIEKKTTQYQGYKMTLLNNDKTEELVTQQNQISLINNPPQSNKDYRLENNGQSTKSISLLSKFNSNEDQRINQDSNNDSNNKFNDKFGNSMMSSLQSNGNQNTNRRTTDEEIFQNQRKEAELKRRKQEEAHSRNQQYVSSLNYNKIISDKTKQTNIQNKINEQSKENSMNSILNKAQLDINISTNLNNGNMDIENSNSDAYYKGSFLLDSKMQVEVDQEANRKRVETEEEIIEPQLQWNLRMESRNSINQNGASSSGGDGLNNSGNKKRFKKQNLKKSDSLSSNQNLQGSESDNNTVIANAQYSMMQEQPDQLQGNTHMVGQRKNLNLNKGRIANNNFVKDVNFDDDESGEKEDEQGVNLFAQFEFKKSKPAQQVSGSANESKRPLNIRKKADREQLKQFKCGRCKAAYETLGEEFCGNCSRHRSEYTPPHTPNAHYSKFSQSEDESQ